MSNLFQRQLTGSSKKMQFISIYNIILFSFAADPHFHQ